MLSPQMDLFFDYSCPYAYLAFTQLERLEAASGKNVRLRPMLLGGVFAARGTPQDLMNGLGEAKGRHNWADMKRWAEAFGEPLVIPPEHPRRTVEALRATLVTRDANGVVDRAVVRGFYRAYWVEGRAPSDPQTIRDVVTAAGHDAEKVLRRIGDADVKDLLRSLTDEAIAHDVFGAPSFLDDDGELYWGQDRLHLAFKLPMAVVLPPPAPAAQRAKQVELFFDFSSPFAYLAATQAEAFVAGLGAQLVWRPFLLGGVFKSIGVSGPPLFTFSDAKRRYFGKDIQRCAQQFGVPFQWPSRFPMVTVKALRAYLALPEERRSAFRQATFRAYWAEDRDIADDAVLRDLIGEGAEAVLARTQEDAIKQELIASTERAVRLGVFGAPTWIVDEKALFWGQDRMPLVERAVLLGAASNQ